MFKVGQKVVCVEKFDKVETDDPKLIAWKPCNGWFPVVGEIYEISELYYCGRLHLGLIECPDEGAVFNSNKFRPLDYAFVEEVIKQVQPKKIEA